MAENLRSHTTSPRDVGRGHVSSVDDICSTRVQTIIRLRKEGKSLRQIGDVLGVKRQRVGQLIDKIELRHDAELGRRPEIAVVTKADLPSGRAVQQRLAETIGREVLLISAVTGQGLDTLVGRIAHTLQGEPPNW